VVRVPRVVFSLTVASPFVVRFFGVAAVFVVRFALVGAISKAVPLGERTFFLLFAGFAITIDTLLI
jgi:hypothetical protein